MRKIILIFCFTFLPMIASAANSSTGIGVTVGSPNGFTGRTWFNHESSIDYGAGWSLSDSRQFEIYSDYLWNRAGLIEIGDRAFDLFFGGGLALRSHSGKADNDLVIGPRIPVGASYTFTNPDLELFALFALNVGMIPSSDVFVDLHVGARFYLF